MSKSLSLLFSTERCKQMACDLRESNAKKKRFAQKIRIFCMFYTFFPFLCPRANLSLRSLLIRSLKKSKRGRFNKKTSKRATKPEWFAIFALSLTKTGDWLEKSKSKFPTLSKPTIKLMFKRVCCLCKVNQSVREWKRQGWEFAHHFFEQIACVFVSKRTICLWKKANSPFVNRNKRDSLKVALL